jgi:predicted ferric reductase
MLDLSEVCTTVSSFATNVAPLRGHGGFRRAWALFSNLALLICGIYIIIHRFRRLSFDNLRNQHILAYIPQIIVLITTFGLLKTKHSLGLVDNDLEMNALF